MTSTSPPHEDFFLVRISSLTKRKTHSSLPSPPHEDFFLVRISSLTKRKCDWSPPTPNPTPKRTFLLWGLVLWRWEKLMAVIGICHEFSLCQRGNTHGKNFLVWGRGKGEGIWGFPFWRSKKPHWNFNRISFWDILPGDFHLPPPLPWGFVPCEDFLFEKDKNSLLSTPSHPPSQEDFSLVRISSLTKRKTHGCPWKLPWSFLFVKEEILMRRISLWKGEGMWGFPHW